MGGLIPLGTAACADGRLHWDILFYSLPLICGIALIMMSNNGCDIEKDILAGRRTLPTVLGREKTLALYRSLVVLWILLLVLMAFLLAGQFGFVCPVLLILFGGRHFRRILRLGLLPEQRILQMKGIAAANLFGNGALILTLLVKMTAEVSRV
jgi:1,4-dihydroxy-2-naphthoate octaprenyltransferase